MTFCVNGRLVAPSKATVLIDDWGFRYGWGAFDTLRVHRRRPLFLARHLERLYTAAGALQLPQDVSAADWTRDVYRTLHRARLAEGAVNLYWTAGVPNKLDGRRVVAARRTTLPVSRPVRLWVAPWRIESTTPGVGIKTMAYFSNIFASVCAWNEGFEAALVMNTDDRLADGAMTSVFLVEGDRIATPALSEGALAGITRGLILAAAEQLGIRAREDRIPPARLLRADASFITSAIRGIAAVKAVGDRDVRPKPRSAAAATLARLRRRYARMVADEIAATPPAF
ncbi:MAG TPA: aminotransferase class IV [Acidobacteriota bacterium]|nr:aminotransferase class IV [Acidobacteriota bacterium]